MWKIYYKNLIGGQNPDFWGEKLKNLDVGCAKEMGKEDYIKEIFLKYFPKKGKILDAGCGTGQHVLAYRDLGYQIEGLDFSAKAIERIIKFDNNAPCSKGDILQIKAPDRSYECYYSLGVFEHFEEGPFAAIEEARRILRDNGIFMLSIPYENLFRIIKFNILNLIRKLIGQSYISTNVGFIKKVNRYCKPDKLNDHMEFHEYICSKNEIINLLTFNGFRIEYSSPCSIIWGLLEIPYMRGIYRLINNNLQKKSKTARYGEVPEKIRKRNLLKDIVIYEKRNGVFKSFIVKLLGYMFGNLFLVVCRKA